MTLGCQQIDVEHDALLAEGVAQPAPVAGEPRAGPGAAPVSGTATGWDDRRRRAEESQTQERSEEEHEL
jgi:hypothetical protein